MIRFPSSLLWQPWAYSVSLRDGDGSFLPRVSFANRAGYKGLVLPGANAPGPHPCPSFLPLQGSKPSCWLLAGQVRLCLAARGCRQASLLSSVPSPPPWAARARGQIGTSGPQR